MIKNIIFDLNGVFLNINFKKILLKSNLNIFDGLLWWKINNTDIYRGYDLGEYHHRKDKLDEYIKRFPNQEKRIIKILDFPIYDYLLVNEELVDYVKSIKHDYHIFLLSNLGYDDMMQTKNMDFFDIFEDAIFSCQQGVMKPDKELYLYLLNKHNLKAEESIFIDDLKENITAANELDIYGIQFKNTQQIINDINKIVLTK